MSGMPDWTIWLLALLVCAVLVWFFVDTGRVMFTSARQLVRVIQDWPQTRRAMTEAEARSGGRYPLWYRAIRVMLIVAMVLLAALLVWRKLAGT